MKKAMFPWKLTSVVGGTTVEDGLCACLSDLPETRALRASRPSSFLASP